MRGVIFALVQMCKFEGRFHSFLFFNFFSRIKLKKKMQICTKMPENPYKSRVSTAPFLIQKCNIGANICTKIFFLNNFVTICFSNLHHFFKFAPKIPRPYKPYQSLIKPLTSPVPALFHPCFCPAKEGPPPSRETGIPLSRADRRHPSFRKYNHR